jgi:Flp pilus assembly protein TadD
MNEDGARLPLLICLGLIALVVGIYAQTLGHDFLNYDDNEYVTENPIVLQGVTLAGVKYAFGSICEVNWVPTTVLVNMLDCQLYGTWAGGHHLTCFLLHALGSVLLFLWLRKMTGCLWKGALVAALWAVHPLRVESVSWIAEMKDVLSGVFFFLTLMAYTDYARGRTLPRYLLVVLPLSLGLMSKPMLVTVPFLLLLLDYWPLRSTPRARLSLLLAEKLPLLALSVISSLATLWGQKGAIGAMSNMPLTLRIENAILAYGDYLREMVWPFGLALYHPIDPKGPNEWEVALVFLALAAITLWVLRERVKRPCLLVGWFWYLGMLVPVIGLLKVGSQAYADRYTYLPTIGILIAIVWGVDGIGRQDGGRIVRWLHTTTFRVRRITIILALLIAGLTLLSWKQTRRWANSATLWQETLDSIGENDKALMNLGEVLMQQGKIEESEGVFRRALLIDPSSRGSLSNLAATLSLQGRNEEAMQIFHEMIRLDPHESGPHNNLGSILMAQGKYEEATAEFRQAVAIDGNPQARCNLATCLMREGRLEESEAEFRNLLKSNPVSPMAHNNLGSLLMSQGRLQEAIAEFRQALTIDSAYPSAKTNLDQALKRQEAIQKGAP